MRDSVANASDSGSSVVPGLPNRCRTPLSASICRRAAAPLVAMNAPYGAQPDNALSQILTVELRTRPGLPKFTVTTVRINRTAIGRATPVAPRRSRTGFARAKLLTGTRLHPRRRGRGLHARRRWRRLRPPRGSRLHPLLRRHPLIGRRSLLRWHVLRNTFRIDLAGSTIVIGFLSTPAPAGRRAHRRRSLSHVAISGAGVGATVGAGVAAIGRQAEPLGPDELPTLRSAPGAAARPAIATTVAATARTARQSKRHNRQRGPAQ